MRSTFSNRCNDRQEYLPSVRSPYLETLLKVPERQGQDLPPAGPEQDFDPRRRKRWRRCFNLEHVAYDSLESLERLGMFARTSLSARKPQLTIDRHCGLRQRASEPEPPDAGGAGRPVRGNVSRQSRPALSANATT